MTSSASTSCSTCSSAGWTRPRASSRTRSGCWPNTPSSGGCWWSDPALAERAVEEALRYEPITPFTARITTAEVTYRDVTFPAGTVVMVCAFTGNRDLDEPGGGEAPDEFDITADSGAARGR